MQGLFNKQQSFHTLPLITSLFSKGQFATKDIVTVCCRKVVTSSKCALHHGKGVTFKLQRGRGSGNAHNAHSPRNARAPADSKSYKTSSWLKKSKSGKSSGSSCTVAKRRKGKIIFRVARQPVPKVIPEEHTQKVDSNCVNKAFDTKLVRARKSKHRLSDSTLADARPPAGKLSLPQFKDTSIIDVSRGKSVNNFSFTAKKSHTTDLQKVVKQNQGFVKGVSKNEDSVSSNLQSGTNVDSNSKLSHVGESMSVSGIPANICMASKVKKDASTVSTTQKQPPKARSKRLVFSSSEMLFSNNGCSDDVGVGKIKKLENTGKDRELRKLNESQVKDGAHHDVLQMENSSIQPLEENCGLTMKLFMGKGNNGGVAGKGSSLTDTVKNIMKLGNDVVTLNLDCIGEKCVLQASKVDKPIGEHIIPRTVHKNTEVGKEQKSSIGKSDGLSPSLIGDIASGDKPFQFSPKAPMEFPQTKTSPKVQTYKRDDNVTLHRHMGLKRPTKEGKVEFDTTVIEQEGKKITKIKPKHNSDLRKETSNRSGAMKKSKVYLGDVVHNPEKPSIKSHGSSEIQSSALATKPNDSILDRSVILEDTEKINLAEIDPFIPKVNLQSANTIKFDKVIIPEDGRVIKEGEYNWPPKENKHGQNTDAGKRSFPSDDLVIPQDGNTIPFEAETDSFISKNSSLPIKKNPVGKSTTYTVDNGMVKRDGTKPTGGSSSFLSNSLGINQHVFVQSKNMINRDAAKPSGDNSSTLINSVGINKHVFVQSNLHSQEAMQSNHRTSLREAVQLKKKTETAKGSLQTVSEGVTKPDIAQTSNQIAVNRISQTAVKNSGVESVLKEPVGLNQVTKIISEKQNVKPPGKENTSWRSWLPLSSTKNSNNQEKIGNKKEPLHPLFADIFTTVNVSTGTSGLSDGPLSRNVIKIKVNPQTDVAPTQTQNSSISIPLSKQEIQQTAEPKTNVTSDSATAAVLRSRIAQSLPEADRLTTFHTHMANGYSQAHSGITATNNSVTGNSQLGYMSVMGTNPPANSSLIGVGTHPAGQFSISCRADNSLVKSGINNCNPVGTCNTPKAIFPPTCHNPQQLCGGSQASCSTDACNTRSVFPPPCPTQCETPSATAISEHLLGGWNQAKCSKDGCNTKTVFPPPCPTQCASHNGLLQLDEANSSCCSTCKPAFPPPCPSTSPCSSSVERAENTCYDPCNPVTKSRTHTIMDVDKLTRPPTPICIDCVPKSKPCFPPKCPEQCENPPNQMVGNTRKVSLAGWRAYMNYSYWSVKCLLSGVFENLLALLKARIMHVCEYKIRNNCQNSIHHPQECKVMQSAVVLPKKSMCMSKFNRNNKHVHQKAKPNPTNKIRKKVRVVRSVKKSVLDDKSKQAIFEEERKRKYTGAKATPALAYSEVLNIVFSQRKSA